MAMLDTQSTKLNKRGLRLLWDRLTKPSIIIEEVGLRRQVRFLSAFTLALFLIMLTTTIATMFNGTEFDVTVALIATTAFLAVAYIFSRLRWYTVGAYLVVGSLTIIAYGRIWFGEENVALNLYAFIPLAFLFSTILLSLPTSTVVVGANFLAILTLPLWVTNFTYVDLGVSVGPLFSLGVLFLLAQNYRNNVERDRLGVLVKTNRELENLRVGLDERVKLRTQELEEANDQVRTILESVVTPVIIARLSDAIITYVNQPAADALGETRDALLGRTPLEFYYDSAEAVSFIEQLQERGFVTNYDQRLKRKDGSSMWTLASSRLMNYGGEPAIITTLVDITERSETEQAIRERETLLRTIIDSTPDWIFVKDLEHRYLMVNQSYANSFHMAPDDFVGKNDLEIGFSEEIVKGNPEKGIRGLSADDNEIMAQGEVKVIDEEPAIVDGETRFLNTIKAPLKDSTGKVTGVVGFVHDITDQKQVQVALQQREADLISASELAGMASWTLNMPQMTFTTNDQFYKLLRTTVEDVGGYEVGIGAFIEQFVHPEDGERVQAKIASDLQQTDPTFRGQIEYRAIRGDGTVLYAFVEYRMVFDEQGQPVAVNGAYLDITKRKLAEQKLQEEQKRTQEILESISVPLVVSKVADGTVAYVNEPLAEIIRVPRDELIGKLTPDFYSDPKDRITYLNTLREHGQVSNYDLRLKRSDGDHFWALISGQVIDFQGEPAIISSLIDINERRAAQATVARRAVELETVADLGTVAATLLDPDELLQQVVDLTKDRFNLYHAHVYLLNDDQTELVLTNGAGEIGRTMVAEGRQIALNLEKSLVARAARFQRGVVTNDVHAEPDFLPHSLLPDTRSEMAVPLIAGNVVLGVLDVQADSINRFTTEDISIFTTMAAQVSVALQNARRHDESQRALDELTRLQRVMAREGWEAFLMAQERPTMGYAFDSKGVQLIEDKENELATVAATNGHAVEEETDAGMKEEVETAVSTPDASISIPISVRGVSIGKIGLHTPDGSPIPERSQAMLQTITQQMSEALERARLFEETEIARSQTETLYAGIGEVVRSTSMIEVLMAVVNSTKLKELSRVSLMLFDKPWDERPPENIMPVAGYTRKGVVPEFTALSEQAPLESIPFSHLFRRDAPLIVADIQTDERADEKTRTFFKNEFGLRSVVSIPLIVGGDWIGMLSGGHHLPSNLTEDDIRQISSLADQAASVIQTLRLFDEAQNRARDEQMLRKVTNRVNAAVDAESILRTAAEEIGQALGLETFVLLEDANVKKTLHHNTNGNGEDKKAKHS